MKSIAVSELVGTKIVGILEFKGQLVVATECGVFIKNDDDVFRPVLFEVKPEPVKLKYFD